MMVDPKCLNAVAGEQGIEVAATAGDRDRMTEPALLAGEIDRCVHMAVGLGRMVQKVEDTHGPIPMLAPPIVRA